MKLRIFMLLPLVGVSMASPISITNEGWQVQPAATMAIPRAAHQGNLLPSNEILITGGCSGSGCSSIERTAELIDSATGKSIQAGKMQERRVSHIAAPLTDGRVLVAGGWNGSATTASAEIYDRQKNLFESVGAMATARMDATATTLKDGSILIVGGAKSTNQAIAHAEIFQAPSARFKPVANMNEARAHHSAVRLQDGRVLIVGGLKIKNVATRTAEIFDPITTNFQTTGSMAQARCKHSAVLLRDGRVMIIAGSTDCDERRRIAETEIFDPKTGKFEAGPRLINPRYKIIGATAVLPDGSVIVAGDANDVEVWKPGQTNFVKTQGGIGKNLSFSVATTLPNGEVIVTGGYDNDIQATNNTWRISKKTNLVHRN